MHGCVLLVSPGGLVLAAKVGGEKRRDLVTASRVDLALVLLPAVTWLDASVMLAASGVPADVAARVMALPLERRTIDALRLRTIAP